MKNLNIDLHSRRRTQILNRLENAMAMLKNDFKRNDISDESKFRKSMELKKLQDRYSQLKEAFKTITFTQ